MAQTVKRLSTMQETRVQSLGWEDPLEKEISIHSSTIAWKIRWRTDRLPNPVFLGFLVAQLVKIPPTMQETWD